MTHLFRLAVCGGVYLALSTTALAEELTIRVGLADSLPETTVSVSNYTPVRVQTNDGWQNLGTLNPSMQLKVQIVGGQVRLSGPIETQSFQRVQIIPEQSEQKVSLRGAWYRGGLDIYPNASRRGLTVVNELSLEKYLYGVLPSEMPASWPSEALKSQAIAARTYALSHLGGYSKQGYDLVATTSSQVYSGVKAETSSSNQAVDQTEGKILTYNSAPINAYFHSTSGGQTESGSELWAPFPYLNSVTDFDHQSPKHVWYQEYSQKEIKAALARAKVNVGDVLGFEVPKRTISGRVKTLKVVGTKGNKEFDGAKFRTLFNLNSTFFNVGAINAKGELLKDINRSQVPNSFQFAGRGWGHGIGMSQWGARQMALNGYRHEDILLHYYRNVKIDHYSRVPLKLARSKF